MGDHITEISDTEDCYPPLLGEIPVPPQRLWIRGHLPDPNVFTYLTVVGTRRPSQYGHSVSEKIIQGLKGLPIAIVSGLALGTDALAHEAALAAGLPTIAIPGSGLDDRVIAPRTNLALARRILDAGGALLSEFPPMQSAAPWTFPQRNRIMAGLSKATLVIEAARPSGTLITTKLATDFNRDVLAVPGDIFSELSAGPNFLIRMGAVPITNPNDLIEALGIPPNIEMGLFAENTGTLSPEEQAVLSVIRTPLVRESLATELGIAIDRLSVTLMRLEIAGFIEDRGGLITRIR
jgi:DNA processing protein